MTQLLSVGMAKIIITFYMKRFVFLFTALLFFASNVLSAKMLSLKEITSRELLAENLGTVTPLNDGVSYAMMSGDGKKILKYSYKTGRQTGVLFDVDTTVGEKINAVEGYILSPDAKKILVRTDTKMIYRRSFTATYYIYNIADRKMEKLSDGGPQQSPVWSPDGLKVAFVRDNNIYIVKLLYGNAETQVTKDGKRNVIINGIPDWVNEEEFATNTSMTFNADGSALCWIRYDEEKVPMFSLQTYKGLSPENTDYKTYPGVYEYKYPKAGEKNSVVTVMSYDIQSRQTRRMQIDLSIDGYIPRIKPTADADKIIVCTLNRHQSELCLYAVNPRSTVCQLLIKENSPTYIKEEVLENLQVTNNHILLPSDRSGFMQVYLYSLTGQLNRQLTSGRFDVTRIYGYDETDGKLYYQATGESAINRYVFVVSKSGKTERLTQEKGWNEAFFSSDYKYFINSWSDCNTPYEYNIFTSSGKKVCFLKDNKALKDKLLSFELSSKEFFTFVTPDGVSLNGVMIKPKNFDPNKKYPVIMWQYGGPGSQQVVNSWHIGSMGQGALFDSYLVQQGFILVCVDGRGTGGRGSDFQKCTYLNLGKYESKDQVETAVYLSSLPYIDKSNIGIWGWSYGGFNTLMSMSEGRGVFKAGVAVAPPTDWRFYDTVYTERFMRTPKENPNGYGFNPISRADKLQGKLLICHGLADDNVHPQNTFEYSEALVQADKDFKMNIYTNRNHSIYGGNTRNHIFRQIASFFIENLK